MPGSLEGRVELGGRQQLGDRLGGTPREDRVAVAEEDERGAVEADAAPRAPRASSAQSDDLRSSRRAPGTARCRRATPRVGNGASYAAITSSVVGWTSERRTSCPATMSRSTRRMNAWKRSHSSFGARAPMPVFMTTRRATRSGFSTANRKPIGPPQSCTTTVTSRRSSSAAEPRDRIGVAVVGVPLALRRLVGAAEAEVVRCDASCSLRQLRDHRAVEERPRGLAVQQQHRLRRRPRPGSACAARPARRSSAGTGSRAGLRSGRRRCGRRPVPNPPADDCESSAWPTMRRGPGVASHT